MPQEDDTASAADHFTLVQSRRLRGKSPSDVLLTLCPSMDIMWLQNSLYRTLYDSPKLATVPFEQSDVPLPAWRPDGQWLATSPDGKCIQLYSLENLISVSESTGNGANKFIPIRTDNNTGNVGISKLTWALISNGHHHWQPENNESLYSHRPSLLLAEKSHLPPSEYHNEHTVLSTTDTPLSILAVLLQDGSFDLYLHGRYPVLSNYNALAGDISNNGSSKKPLLQVSPDLTHYMFMSEHKLKIVHLPRLGWHRKHWQSLTSMYTSMQYHLNNIHESLPVIIASYKSALSPLDKKLEGLVTLLQRYQVYEKLQDKPIDLLRYALVQSLQAGHVPRSETLNNALDQYFTSVAMNDQLMQRLERSLQVAVANLEISIKKQLLAPAQAMLQQIKSYLGHSRAHPELCGEQCSPRLFELCHILDVTLAAFHRHWVDARCRWQDLVSWLRANASVCKSRGTAPNSVQREQAVKKRLDQQTWHRIQAYLTMGNTLSSEDAVSMSESVVGLQLSQWFADTDAREGIVLQSVDNTMYQSSSNQVAFPPIPIVLQKINACLESIRESSDELVRRNNVDMMIDFGKDYRMVAMTTRLGRGNMSDTILDHHDATKGYFNIYTARAASYKQWVLCAYIQLRTNTIHICAIPLSWTDPTDGDESDLDVDDDEENFDAVLSQKHYRLSLSLPLNMTCLDAAFYNDDGRSSLSADTGEEGSRQALILLVECNNEVRLLKIDYNTLTKSWTEHSWEHGDGSSYCLGSETHSNDDKNNLKGSQDVDDIANMGMESRKIVALDNVVDVKSCALSVCSSRGMGSVLINRIDKGLCLSLYDFEEHEENDDEIDEDSNEESGQESDDDESTAVDNDDSMQVEQ